ncbi:MAG: hypothetical protein P8X90_17670 [Desulfobacterales bacterium]
MFILITIANPFIGHDTSSLRNSHSAPGRQCMRGEHKISRRLNKTSLGFFCLALAAAALIGFTAKAAGGDCHSCTKVPPFIGSSIDPNLLLMIDNSASMYDLAYIQNQGECYDDSYQASGNYTGYFDGNTWYAYDPTGEKFTAVTAAAAASLCASASYKAAGELCLTIDAGAVPKTVTQFAARGNFLNWAAASKMGQALRQKDGRHGCRQQQLLCDAGHPRTR